MINIKQVLEMDVQVGELVHKKRVMQALEVLSELVRLSRKADFSSRHEDLRDTYENMLKYTIEGIRDPERQRIYNHLLVSILDLSQEARESIMAAESGWHTYWLRKELEKEQKLSGHDIVETLDDLSFKKELDQILLDSPGISDEAYRTRTRLYREIIGKIFNHLWLTDRYKKAEHDLVNTILDRGHFRWYERSVFVSAVTLSLLRYFDEKKVYVLFDILETGEDEVWQRALVGLVFAFYLYDKRLHLYAKTGSRLGLLAERAGIQQDTESIILQIIRSKDTEKISRRLRDEIIPEMAKLRPNLHEKLDLDNLIAEDFLEEKNPEWQKVFEESEGLYNKVEEFSRLQLEGADVFMSAFAMLKHFDFFRNMSNWFLPFYPENDLIDEALMHEDPAFDKSGFIEGLYKTGFLCNSDKYSFCLNVKQMPAAQKSIILKAFNMEISGMNEMAAEERLADPRKRNQVIYRQYLQDLYRFYKLYPNKREFPDIFKGKLNLYQSGFFSILVGNDAIVRNIANYFLNKDYFEEALEIYLSFYTSEKDRSAEILEKIAFCNHQLGRYGEALEYYRQAEMFEANRLWNLKKIGACYRQLKEPVKALEYYLQAEKIEPENLYTQTSIGRCYLDMKEYEPALRYYFKVEYLDPGNQKVLRPIAWCYFALGNLSKSKKYYEKLFASPLNKYDYINRGHVEWCSGNRDQALEYYRVAVKQEGLTLGEFVNVFWDDREYLIMNGMDADEVPIILDYLQYQLKR